MSEKAKAIISYIIPIAAIIFFATQKEDSRNAKMHYAQAITIWICYIVLIIAVSILTVIVRIPFISSLAYIAWIIFIIMGIVKACNEGDAELPFIGGIAKSIFGKAIGE